jgi:hypothetical protein
MTDEAAPPRQVWHEKAEAMRHNNGPDGKRAQKIETKDTRRMNMSDPGRKHFFRAAPCFWSRGDCSARHRLGA